MSVTMTKKAQTEDWHGKRYYSLDAYCKNTYHEKLYKIALNAGFTCPNRDGTLDHRGCIFCSAGGSGDFAVSNSLDISMREQIEAGCSLFSHKRICGAFIAYFQAYTNTYAPVDYLEKVYRQALEESCIRGISIATRPDCISDAVLMLLQRLKREYPDKFIWVELGFQTMHENTAKWMRRGYENKVFDHCVEELKKAEIPVIVHVIIGLPGEGEKELLQTINYLNERQISGIKLQLLHYLKGTDLGALYENGAYQALEETEYVDLLICALEHLSPKIVVHRLTGDGPKELLLAPLWSLQKRNVLNRINRELKERDTRQGRCVEWLKT